MAVRTPSIDATRAQALRDRGLWRGETLHDWLEQHARATPTAQAILGPNRSYTYAELLDDALAIATGLEGLGVGRGDVVALQLPNIEEFVAAYLGITRLGAIVQPLHMPYREAD